MKQMTAETFISFLAKIEKLKSVTRHCYTADGVHEDVAAHSWRAAMMALLLQEKIEGVNMDKVIKMCLIHDLGEAVTGDIPTFEKQEEHEETEKVAVDGLIRELPESLYMQFRQLFDEMEALQTPEAKVYKAIDKLEAVIQHNESDISTWLPLEYELQKTYAEKNVEGFPFLEEIHRQTLKDTERKIREKNINEIK